MVKQKLHSKKIGFTLIELTITIGILGLALTATGGILVSVVKSFQKQAEIQRVERNGDNVTRLINERVRKAKNVTSGTGTYSGKTYNYIEIFGVDSTGADTKAYLGFVPDLGNCPSNPNGFMFLIEGPIATIGPIGSLALDNENYRLTDDRSDGVNIESFTVSVSNGSPVQVSATIQVESSNCSGATTRIVKKFTSFATARASY